ncbi:ABC transporter G family member 20-like [Dysidea avara]|uniref:ABC transporter G family member 20-like n=1 Tax=Dysidea avara TaxID=196820 RepID=UPI00332CAD04
MRDGRLLAQSSPENLMRAYSTTTLETVFLKLAYQSSRGKDDDDMKDTTEHKDPSQPAPQPEDKPKRKYRLLNFHKFRVLTVTNIVAMSMKNMWKISKSLVQLALLLILPAIQVALYAGLVGGDVRDIKLLYNNNDTAPYKGNWFSRYYLKSLSRDIFDLESISTYQQGLEEIIDGDAWGVLGFEANYTKAVIDRYVDTCSDILSHRNTTNRRLIKQATIGVGIDSTNGFVTQQTQAELYSVANEKLIRKISIAITNSSAIYSLNVYLNLTRFVYGDDDFTFTDFFAPGATVLVIFSSAMMVSATSLIQERKEGVLDRTYVAGVTVIELIFSELLLYSIISIVQVVVVVAIVYGVFDIEQHGNIALASFIYWLISLSGLTLGLLISVGSETMMDVLSFSSLLANTPSFFAGVIWPLEGLPSGVRWVSNLMPFTYAVFAVKGVVSKGMGIGDREVYQGILITLAWLVGYFTLIIIFFRR